MTDLTLAEARVRTAAAPPVADRNHEWLAAFAKRHGRKLRVLHVGNIANNGFLNAKFLRQVGVEADVLCYNYYHIMGTPEWEEIELRHPYGDDFAPRFAAADIGGYQRPVWFIQGPLPQCHEAILAAAKRECFAEPRRWAWRRKIASLGDMRAHVYTILNAAIRNRRLQLIYRRLRLRYVLGPAVVRLLAFVAQLSVGKNEIPGYVREFAAAFPERADKLSEHDVLPFLAHVSLFREIFEAYDVIQLYSTDPIFGWLARNRPYVAFEHGTLRDFTLGDNAVHRLTAMAYRQAGHVFITNGDCLEYARKIGVERYSPMIHPVDVDQHRRVPAAGAEDPKAAYGADILLLCPLRHSWSAKGTDVHLRALPIIRERVAGRRVVLLLSEWGEDIARSRDLIRDLGCVDAVQWLKPLSRIAMIRIMKTADAVLDQMALPCFGATAPQAIAAGVPVISSYLPESTQWIIEEPAPILAAFSPEDVCDSVMTALDPAWREEYQERARRWIEAHHHPRRIVETHLQVYRELIEGRHGH